MSVSEPSKTGLVTLTRRVILNLLEIKTVERVKMKIIGKVLILLIVVVLVAVPMAACRQEVTFPDENLEAAIRYALDKPVGEPITKAEQFYLDPLG